MKIIARTITAALLTSAALVGLASSPANAGTISGATAPTSPVFAPIDIAPSAPTSFTASGMYDGKPFTLLQWTAASAGTSVGSLEYHWKIAYVDPACSGVWQNATNDQGVTSRTDALIPIGNDTLIGCAIMVGVRTLGVSQNGGYMYSPWTYTTYRVQNSWTGSSVTATAPISIVNKITARPNYLNSGLTRLTWSYPTQPAGISNVFVRWYVLTSSGGAADPNLHTSGGEIGTTAMLNLIHGNTYTVQIYTEGVVGTGSTRQPAVPSGIQDVGITFTA